ncbi:MAG: PIN domain-containing protein [Acidimicrobiales bacterium]|nr:PIN domain-containing protein [Acidimicrobiaceae bacterium]MXV88942.1 PIN domain-containing protein [Acidimicrobiales bacterium]MCY3607818.1 PIN domain-containing protein [Acidimicrobiaceae bacterium]MDE0322228.1 PIN domain-containing protein [Acidimicrobiaceae bacterium]MXX42059.1 PIN domain-containing protein [Acidimicrobiales bacterium]
MRLVVDTSVLVGELLRERGRQRLADRHIDLYLPERMWHETLREIPRRAEAFGRHRGLNSDEISELSDRCLQVIALNCTVVAEAVYSAWEDQARERSIRDPSDWPVVACALALDVGVWTTDRDFLGTGVPTWTTQTLDLWIQRTEASRSEH